AAQASRDGSGRDGKSDDRSGGRARRHHRAPRRGRLRRRAMKNYELTCIVCPVGCRITAEVEGGDVRVSGNQCKRGELYCRQEVSCPVRTVTSLVAVEGGELP